jgi:transcription elongation factor Elf1
MLSPKSAGNMLDTSGTATEGELQAEEDSMTRQAETHCTTVASRRIALPSCPNCNDLVFAPAASEFVSKTRVRHVWACEACGHEFSTSVRLFFDHTEHALA